MDGEIIGSLNQGDMNIYRFNPEIDTEYLDRLGIKISLCLSNVTAHEQLKYLAYHDPLTGLLNRRVMEKILQREFLRSKRYLNDLAVIFMDLDNFKSINDNFGHDIGDEALILTAKILMDMKRNSDCVSRFAGDEFVIILPSTGISNAQKYINRVENCLSVNPVITEHGTFHIKLSAGIASVFEKNITSWDKLLKEADKKLYCIKHKK